MQHVPTPHLSNSKVMVLDVSWESSTFVIKPGEFARIPQPGNFISERAFFDTYLFLHMYFYTYIKNMVRSGKGGSVKETFMYDYQDRFYLLFVFIFFYLFQELSFLVFESLGVSAELVFCNEELRFLPYINPNKSMVFSSWQEYLNFAVC